MNRHCYRLVFNKARQMLMVVSELAKNHSSDKTRSGSAPGQTAFLTGKLSALRLAVMLLCGWVALPVTAGGIVADGSAPGNQQPTVISSANGTPQVNIQTPNSDGVSRNQYSQFDVDPKGAILNNSAVNTQTQLGGMVTANPWVAKGEANIILNEVNSANPSQLNGFVEVAGKRADVIIANPAGITCNGCGFINAGQTTMAAAQALLEQGRIKGFDVDKGQIAVTGKGLNDTQSNHTLLIARAVQVNAKLHAQDLTVTTGRNITDAQGRVVTQKAADGSTPAFALDVAALGGMYANKIKLTGTEHGVGVRNAGTLGAQAGELTISADGKLQNSGILTAGTDVNVTVTDSISNTGTVSAGRDIRLNTAGNTDNQKHILAGRHLTAGSHTLTGTAGAVMAAGTDTRGQVNRPGEMTLTAADALTLNGQQQAHDRMTVTARDISLQNSRTAAADITLSSAASLDLRKSEVSASGTLSAAAPDVTDNTGGKLTAGTLTLTGRKLDNTQGRIVQTGTDALTLSHKDGIINKDGIIASGGKDLTLSADRTDNCGGRIQHAGGGTLRITAPDFTGQHGVILSDGNLVMSGGHYQLDNSETAARNITGEMVSLSHCDGKMVQRDSGALALAVQQSLDNTQGVIAGQSLTLSADRLTSQRGKIQGSSSARLTVAGKADNREGELRGGQLTVNARELDNTQGTAAGHDTAAVTADTVNNHAGTLIAGQNLTVNSGSLSGDGDILSAGDMSLTLNDTFRNRKKVQANGSLTMTVNNGIGNEALIQGGKAVTVETSQLTNSRDAEISADNTTLTVKNTLTNTGLIDGITTFIHSNTLTNTATGRLYGDDIALQADTVNNTAAADKSRSAVIAARNSLNIGTRILLNDGGSLITSQGDLNTGRTLGAEHRAAGQTERFDNNGSTLESQGNMTLNIREISNINTGLETRTEETDRRNIHEGVLQGHTQRFDWKDIDQSHKNKYGVHDAVMPDGSRSDTFYEYNYTRVTEETQVLSTEPGVIQSGSDLTVHSDSLVNKDSRVVAGGKLTADIPDADLQNIATKGGRIVTDDGRQIRWYAKKKKKKLGGTKTSQGKDHSDYRPDPVVTDTDLGVHKWEMNAQTDIQAADTGGRSRTSVGAVSTVAAVTEVPAAADLSGQPAGIIIRTGSYPVRLPDNSLFTVKPGSDSQYLVETDPRFTSRKKWLGTDYMQQTMLSDHSQMHKRLGDGYYEQKLITDQIVKLSGQRYLGDYRNDEEQFKALMDNGVTFGKKFNLTPGTALTAEQMALLTGDMVWLVESTVTLADGRRETVLVPQVYARLKPGDLTGDGALLSGRNTEFTVNGQLVNSGTILSKEALNVDAGDVLNQGTISGNDVLLTAQRELKNTGGTLIGGDSLTVNAETIRSETTTAGNADNRHLNRIAGVYVQNDGGKLALNATDTVTLTAADIQNRGKDSKTVITAGNDITMDTVTTARTENGDWGGNNYRHLTEQTDTGTQLHGGDISLSAGRDVTATAAAVSADNALNVAAGRDITLKSGTASSDLTEHSKQSSKGLLSGSSLETHDEVHDRQALGTTLSGNNVDIRAKRNVTVEGGNVVGTQDVNLLAGNNLTVTTSDESRQEIHLRKEVHSGLMGSGGIGFTIGKQKERWNDASQTRTGKYSMIGSLKGNTVLLAGDHYQQTGSTVSSPAGNVVIRGKSVTIDAAENSNASQYEHTLEKKGLTLAVNVPVVQAVQGAIQSVQRVGKSNDGRVNALAAANAAWDAHRAGTSLMNSAQGLMDNGVQSVAQNVSVSLTYGEKKQKDTRDINSTTAQASKINAGKRAVLVATGGGQSDITITGSDISGKQGTVLQADNNINLQAAEQKRHERTGNTSSGWNAGIAASYGQGGASFGITAGANLGKGHGNGDDRNWRNSHIGDMSGQTQITSGGTTLLKGAQVTGSGVNISAENLNIESLQDTMTYAGKQRDMSGQVTVGYGVSGSGSFSQSNVKADYASVQEQSGIFAGQNGYQIDIRDHTDLTGGLITSNGSAEQSGNNRFSTGSLSWRDIRNHAEYSGNSVGISGSASMNADLGLGKNAAAQSDKVNVEKDGKTMPATGLASLNKTMSVGVGHDSDSEKSTTHSGINTANLIINNPENQQQAAEGVKTDITTETAAANSGRLENNFDKDGVFKELNLQVAVTKDFKTNANRQISEYIDDKQAAAREELRAAMENGDEGKRKQALDDIYKLQYQRRYLQLLVGVVAGSPEAAVTQQTLAIAATKMREETVKNSFLSPVVVDAAGTSLSNASARSENIYDGLKMGGGRMDLDAVCGDKNGRCETQEDLQGRPILNTRGYPKLKLNQRGQFAFIGDSEYPSFQKLLATDEIFAKISGATGGNQGSEGTLFGIPYKQRPESIWDYYADTVIESFAGTHDFIGGQLPGFYDEYGNATRGRTTSDFVIVEAWSVAAIPLAAPFAASELVSPELLEFIFSAGK